MEQSLNGQFKDAKNTALRTGNNVGDTAQTAVSTVAEKIKTGAEDLSANGEEIASQLKDRLVQLRDSAGDQMEAATGFVKKYPVATIAGAALLGFAIGKILTRKR
jgi:ElaB/YqjD/DUF883 family membrane-anchored ribosome-binding protein